VHARAGAAALLVAWSSLGCGRGAARPAEVATSFDLGDKMRRLERDLGLSRSQTRYFPQVPAPEDVSPPRWMAVEARGARGPLEELDGPGVVVEVSELGELDVSSAHRLLPAASRAAHGKDVDWIAFVTRVPLEVELTEGFVPFERVDLRLVLARSERVVARGTVEAVPSGAVRVEGHVPEAAVAALVQRALEAARAAPETLAADPLSLDACLADQMTSPREAEPSPACIAGRLTECLTSCHAGNGRSCAEAAYVQEAAEDASTLPLYAEGCAYGDVNACVNWGATVWTLARTGQLEATDEAMRCTMRVFERACEQGEPFGCGMFGKGLVTGLDGAVEVDLERSEALLVDTCERYGLFPCEVLGVLRRNGDFGEDAVALADEATRRACDTGYTPACHALTP